MYHPKWSKVKKQLKDFTCDALKDRVDFQVINYRKAHDQLGRAVITVDKKEMLSMCTILAERATYERDWEISERAQIPYDCEDRELILQINIQAHEEVKAEGILAQYDFFDALEIYLNAPIEDSLGSEDIIVKLFALLDRRVGKRTLRKLKGTLENKHESIQYFFKLRCEAEGIILD